MSGDNHANRIFVFGSNRSGRHGKGSAKAAQRCFGAVAGVGEGRTGQSYAIPTKDAKLRTLPLTDIAAAVERFLEYAQQHPELVFGVVDIGCGLAGYNAEQIAPFFADRPPNVYLLGRMGELC
jgi:hypothetical protein